MYLCHKAEFDPEEVRRQMQELCEYFLATKTVPVICIGLGPDGKVVPAIKTNHICASHLVEVLMGTVSEVAQRGLINREERGKLSNIISKNYNKKAYSQKTKEAWKLYHKVKNKDNYRQIMKDWLEKNLTPFELHLTKRACEIVYADRKNEKPDIINFIDEIIETIGEIV